LWPLFSQWGTVIPGGDGDALIFQWNLWYVFEGGDEPFLWTHLQFAPMGTPLHLHPWGFVQLAMAFPWVLFFGFIPAQGITIFLSHALAGFFTYLLAYRILRSRPAAFLSGLVFCWSPYQLSQAGNAIDLTGTFVIPLFFLVLYAWRDLPSLTRSILLGLAAAGAFYSNFYFFSYCSLFGILWILNQLRLGCIRWRERAFQSGTLVALGVFAVPVAPLLLQAIQLSSRVRHHPGDVRHSADLAGLLLPGDGLYWHRFLNPFGNDLPWSGESTNYLGLVVLALVVLSAVNRYPKDRYWAWAALGALILSLGPVLQLAGQSCFPSHWLGPLSGPPTRLTEMLAQRVPFFENLGNCFAVPLPYLLWDRLPWIEVGRTPARFTVVMYLGLAILAGGGLASLFRNRCPFKRSMLLCTAVVAVLVEFWPAMQFGLPEVHPIFYQVRDTEGDFAILDLHQGNRMNYHQTIHGKRLVGGWIGGRLHHRADQYLRRKGIRPLWRNRVNQRFRQSFEQVAREANLQLVIVPRDYTAVRAALHDLGWHLVVKDADLAVFVSPQGRT
jgi:hypothetical protein